MDLLKSFTNEDFNCKNLWIWTGGNYTDKGYYIPVCIDVVENTKMALDLYTKRKNMQISIYKWFPK